MMGIVSAVLAVALLTDVLMSIHPPRFIRDCLDGVRFPREWWWVLVTVKVVAIAGLAVGFWIPAVGFAASAGVVAYFACAAVAHVRARFLGPTFWVNCLGMCVLSGASLLASAWRLLA